MTLTQWVILVASVGAAAASFILPDVAEVTRSLAAQPPADAEAATCDGSQVSRCLSQWYVAAGVPGAPFGNVEQFVVALDQWLDLDHGAERFSKLCRAREGLVDCLGGPMAARQCFTVAGLMHAGMSTYEAARFHYLFGWFDFLCGRGFTTLMNDWKCLYIIGEDDSAARVCNRHFTEGVLQTPSKKCMYATGYAACVSRTVEKCGKPGVWLICERMRLFLQALQLKCNIKCTGNGPMMEGPIPSATEINPLATAVYFGSYIDMDMRWSPLLANPDNPQTQMMARVCNDKIFRSLSSAYPTAMTMVHRFTSAVMRPATGSGPPLNVVRTRFMVRLAVASGTTEPSGAAVTEQMKTWARLLNFHWQRLHVASVTAPSTTPSPGISASPGWVRAAQLLDEAIDMSKDPCTDFYSFACGKWIDSHPLQPHQSGVETFLVIYLQLLADFQRALMKIDVGDEHTPRATKQARLAYDACINSNSSNYNGSELIDLIGSFGGWPMVMQQWDVSMQPDLSVFIGKLSGMHNVDTLLSAGVSNDWLHPTSSHLPRSELFKQRCSVYQMVVDQASLIFPGTVYRPDVFPMFKSALKRLMKGIATVVGIAMGHRPDDAQLDAAAEDMIQLELTLHNITRMAEERRNFTTMLHPMAVTDMQQRWSAFDWNAYLMAILTNGNPPSTTANLTINVLEPGFLDSLQAMFSSIDKRTLQNYLIFRLIAPLADFLPMFDDVLLDFKRQTDGVEALPPSHLRCALKVTGTLPYAAGRLYVDEHFSKLPDATRRDVTYMISNVLSAFRGMVKNLRWMDEQSKQGAYDKVNKLVRNVAYPDFILNNAALDAQHPVERLNILPSDSYFTVINKLTSYQLWYYARKLDMRVDRKEWGATAATVNAFYSDMHNSISICAGIINSPLYHDSFPRAVNYGGLGVILGHELTHAFDDHGVQWNGDGRLDNWIDERSYTGFESMAHCVIEEYSNFCYPNISMCVSGARTQGENIADNGGLRASWRAFKAQQWLSGPQPRLPGRMSRFSMDQVFFLSFARSWCTNERSEATVRRILFDSHSPNDKRVLGSIVNVPAFARAFNCPVGSPMAPRRPCNVWV